MSAKRGLCGRADLLRALHYGDQWGDQWGDQSGDQSGEPTLLSALAQRLGYIETEAPPAKPERAPPSSGQAPFEPPGEGESSSDTDTDTGPSLDPRPLRPLQLWQLHSRKPTERSNAPPATSGETRLPVWQQRPSRLPRAPELASWSDLLPRLRRELGEACAGHAVDIPRLIHHIARARQLEKLPRRRHRRWGSQIHIIEDRSQHLTPYWHDQRGVGQRLLHLLPRYAVHHGLCQESDLGQPPLRLFEPPPIPGSLVLVLGDLGLLAPNAGPALAWWLQLGRQLAADGCRLLALSPAATRLYPAQTRRYWRLLSWERGAVPSEQGARERQLQRLLTLASIASRIEPGLLRELRRLIRADAAVEAEVWRHPALIGDASEAATPAPGEVHRRRDELSAECPDIRRDALQLLRDWRAGLPDEIWFIEIQNLSSTEQGLLPNPRDLTQSRNFIATLGRQARGVNDSQPVPGAISWFADMAPYLPPDYLKDPELSPHFHALWAEVARRSPTARLPDGIQPGEMPPRPELPLRRVQVWQQGRRLLATLAGQPPAGNPGLLGELLSGDGVLRLEQAGRPRTLRVSNDGDAAGQGIALPQAAGFTLISDQQTLSFEPRSLSDYGWAAALGRDRYGLWAEIQIDSKAGPAVTQRLRWCPPGRFEMGSPDDEPGRLEREGPQQAVTLAQGFWLFDTPVTQALWQSVMDDNPSEFKSPDRPVEQVSWEDSQAFIERINQRISGLNLELPSEACWEYACRAGSTSALYNGAIEILGDANAPALDVIAWYGGNSMQGFELDNGQDAIWASDFQYPKGKAGSHPVGQKRPNDWGLYDMLGNVWEWTADAWQDSHEGAAADGAARPGQPDARRVVRGGSWYSSAGYVRSAIRIDNEPGNRNDNLGLRCARVQGS